MKCLRSTHLDLKLILTSDSTGNFLSHGTVRRYTDAGHKIRIL